MSATYRFPGDRAGEGTNSAPGSGLAGVTIGFPGAAGQKAWHPWCSRNPLIRDSKCHVPCTSAEELPVSSLLSSRSHMDPRLHHHGGSDNLQVVHGWDQGTLCPWGAVRGPGPTFKIRRYLGREQPLLTPAPLWDYDPEVGMAGRARRERRGREYGLQGGWSSLPGSAMSPALCPT